MTHSHQAGRSSGNGPTRTQNALPGGIPGEGNTSPSASDTPVEKAEVKAEAGTAEEKKLTPEEENKDLREQLKRMQAEFVNFSRRKEKEKEDFCTYARESLFTELLPLLDNLERAQDASQTPNVESLREGIQLITKQTKDLLSKEGVSEIEALGQPFNPVFHQAVMQEETDEYPEDTIVQVLKKGYAYKGRVIRPAMVKLAKPCQEKK